MPPDIDYTVGRVYHIIQPPLFQGGLHSNRYRPTVPANDKEKLLYALLSQFHSNAFLSMRFPPQGTVAIIRAKSNEYLDIMIR